MVSRRQQHPRPNPEIEVNIDAGIIAAVMSDLMDTKMRPVFARARSARDIVDRLHPSLREIEGPAYLDRRVLRHLLFLHEHGLIEMVGVDRISGPGPTWLTKWTVDERALQRMPKWPNLVIAEGEANELVQAPHFHDFLRDHANQAWMTFWEFPGYLSLSTEASPISIAISSDTRNHLSRPWGTIDIMLNISVLNERGDEIAEEQGYYGVWPKSSIEAAAIIIVFMDRYHP